MDKRLRLFDILGMETGRALPDDIQVFIADDIQYQVDNDDSVTNDVTLPGEHYGIVAPPFKHFWVEARTDLRFMEAIEGDTLLDVMSGAVVQVDDDPESIKTIYDNPNAKFLDLGDRLRWMYTVRSFRYESYRYNGDNLYFGSHVALVPVDSDGIARFDESGLVPVSLYGEPQALIENIESMRYHNQMNRGMQHHLFPANLTPTTIPLILRTINALHRKTELIQIEHPRNFKRAMQRKYGIEPRNNYYLKVGNAPRKTYPIAEQATRKATKKRAHYRVGHFKYYSDEKPHVSGLTGMMWVSSALVHRDSDTPIYKRYQVDGES